MKKIIKISAIIFLGALTNTQIYAQEQFTLKDCIKYSLKNHASNTVYNNEITIAKQRGREALAGYLPQVYVNATYDNNIKRPTTVFPASPLTMGQEVKLQLGQQYTAYAAVQIDQPIYDQALIYGLKANRPNQEIATLNKAKNEENLIYNTAAAYYQVLSYQEQEKILADNEKKYNDLLSILKLRVEKGVTKKIDYDRLRVSLNNVTSQKNLVQTNKQVALNSLKYAMGMPFDQNVNIVNSIDTTMQVALPEVAEPNVSNRLDIKLQEKSIMLQYIDLQRKKAAFLPTLTSYGRYGAQSFSNELSKSVSNWFDFAVIGLKLNLPIYSGMRKISQLKQSELTLKNAQINLELSTDNLKLGQENAHMQIQRSYNSLSINRENLILAKSVFDTSQLEYQQGVATLTDFLNSDYAYKEAQSNYITALLNYLSAQLDYERAQGTLKNFTN